MQKYIKKSLESCLNQSFKDLEIIVIDDGSTDNSKSIINKYSKDSSLITAIFQKNLGLINHVIEHCMLLRENIF